MPKRFKKNAARSNGKRVPLNMRTTSQLRRKIERAAEQSGRSLAQEVELRLEQSFQQNAMHLYTLGMVRAAIAMGPVGAVAKRDVA